MPQKLLVVGLVGLSAVVPFLFATTTVAFYLIVLFFMVFFEALIFPAVSTLVSKLSDKKEQGEFLGINQSVQAAGFSLAPLFTGSFVVAYPLLPVWVCIVCALSGVVVLRLYKFNQRLSAPLVE
jgi:MFS family permease